MCGVCVYEKFFENKFFSQNAPFLKLVFFLSSQIHFQNPEEAVYQCGVKSFRDIFFIILGHLLGHKGEHWSLLKKKRKNNKKKTNHSLDGKLVVILEKVGPEKKNTFWALDSTNLDGLIG